MLPAPRSRVHGWGADKLKGWSSGTDMVVKPNICVKATKVMSGFVVKVGAKLGLGRKLSSVWVPSYFL